jgi:hypothetical protein
LPSQSAIGEQGVAGRYNINEDDSQGVGVLVAVAVAGIAFLGIDFGIEAISSSSMSLRPFVLRS